MVENFKYTYLLKCIIKKCIIIFIIHDKYDRIKYFVNLKYLI